MSGEVVRASRRTFVAAGAAGLLSTSLASRATAARGRRRAYVLVVDGCRPDEITPTLTPTLAALRDGGLDHPRATSLPVMETIPNHVMMMTGVRPDRSGVPANVIYDRKLRDTREMDRPRDIRCRTVLGRLNEAGFTTGTVLSKTYLHGIFGKRATHRWEPRPIVPVSGHAPDAFTMDAALSMVEEHDPNLVFVNLGDVDRMGHADETGPLDLRALRQVALADADRQVSRFVDLLKSSGRWKNSVVIVLADHSMDWSNPDQVISLTGPLEDDPFLAGRFAIASNGGADLLYWTGPAADRDRAVNRMRAIAADTPGVLSAHDRRLQHESLRLGPEAGDVVVYCRSGWRFTEPDPSGNPIPGNHGHPATRPIPFFIGGGHPAVPRRTASSELARTVDVAPTVAAFFGVGGPRGGYDGRNRL
jgi:hypothetical protein